MKEKKNVHVAQEPHTAAECRINEAPHNHPDVDCGHTVWDGPAMALDEYRDRAPSHACVPDHGHDDDPDHGPGVQ